jgi:hypothetical protein
MSLTLIFHSARDSTSARLETGVTGLSLGGGSDLRKSFFNAHNNIVTDPLSIASAPASKLDGLDM